MSADQLIDLDAVEADYDEPVEGVPIPTSYKSREVAIPHDFLRKAPHDAKPITAQEIDWSKTALPENGQLYAAVLDNVLSASECAELLRLVEASADDRGPRGDRVWKKALVNVGPGMEVLEPSYRNSDRIVWDNQDIVDRLWERCATAPGIREKLAVINEPPRSWQKRGNAKANSWKFRHFNMRMRFLKYQAGQYFRPHCDGAYSEVVGDVVCRTHYTVHLYLNDSVAEAGEGAGLVGGATTFFSPDERRRVDVNPRAGRVLIFQHAGLLHSGDEVVSGVKYTMRTDIQYELVRPDQ